MIYSEEFKQLLTTHPSQYIGCGNPNANILIIGKESAISKEKIDQIHLEMNSNYYQWSKNVEKNLSPDDVGIEYNPLYPYKGQKYCVRMGKKGNASFGECGTSRTWYQYQKLWNSITKYMDFHCHDVEKGISDIDFHKYCFSTDLSTATARYSNQVSKEERKNSIDKRKKLFAHPFFQQFPIVILSVGHYPKLHEIDLERLFRTKWDGQTKTLGHFWYNIHHSTTNKPKLIIHANHLSIVSDDFINKLAEICATFAKDNHIELI